MIYYDNIIWELDDSGQVLTEIKIHHLFVAVPLKNGNLLIGTGKERVVEMDRIGENIFWEITGDDLPVGFIEKPDLWLCAQHLKNGDTLISTHKGLPHVFEVTPDKEVVWFYSGEDFISMLGVQVLDEKLNMECPEK